MRKMSAKLRNGDRGAAMIVALLCVMVLSILGAALWQYFMTDTNHVARDERGMQAYYIARSGADATGQYIARNPDKLDYLSMEAFITKLCSVDKSDQVAFGKGDFSIKVTRDADKTIHIKSEGVVKDTTKNITLTLVPIGVPDTPGDALNAADIGWMNGNSHNIDKDLKDGKDKPVKFHPGNDQTTMKVTPQKLCWFTAPSIYFEHAVAIDNAAKMALTADTIVFRGEVTLNDKQGKKGNPDQLVLHVYGAGVDKSIIPGANMDPNVKYGVVYFCEGAGDTESKIQAGGYFFPDNTSTGKGCSLPYNGGISAWTAEQAGLIYFGSISGYKLIWQ